MYNMNIINNNTNMYTHRTYTRLQLKNMRVYKDNNKLHVSVNNFIANIINEAKDGHTSYKSNIKLYNINECNKIKKRLGNIFINSLITGEVIKLPVVGSHKIPRLKEYRSDNLTTNYFKGPVYYCRINVVWK